MKYNYVWDDIQIGSVIGDAHYGAHGVTASMNERMTDANVVVESCVQVPLAGMSAKIAEWLEEQGLDRWYTNKEVVVADKCGDYLNCMYSYDARYFGIMQFKRVPKPNPKGWDHV